MWSMTPAVGVISDTARPKLSPISVIETAPDATLLAGDTTVIAAASNVKGVTLVPTTAATVTPIRLGLAAEAPRAARHTTLECVVQDVVAQGLGKIATVPVKSLVPIFKPLMVSDQPAVATALSAALVATGASNEKIAVDVPSRPSTVTLTLRSAVDCHGDRDGDTQASVVADDHAAVLQGLVASAAVGV